MLVLAVRRRVRWVARRYWKSPGVASAVAKMPGPGLRPCIGMPAVWPAANPSGPQQAGSTAAASWCGERSGHRGQHPGAYPASIVEQYEAATTRCWPSPHRDGPEL